MSETPLDKPFPLPPFVLDEPLATGGMAQVWRGRHATSDAPVAIKIMRGDQAWKPAWLSAFRAEVRAVAGLTHPNIVQVHDYGLLPDEAEHINPGLTAGTPYLVMEYVPGGTLVDHQIRGWGEFRWLVSSLLDALAEAHAHGVVHRDIKPANVLIDVVQGRVKLTDFGIAHAMDRAELSVNEFEGGTPPYMAPEQFEARWRDYGPWTDLYALGCLAWTCVAGHPPFGRVNWMEGAIAHCTKPLPPLHTRFPVPPTLERWLHRLLQKRPEHRFRRAADAAWELLHMDDAPEPILVGNLPATESPTVVLSKNLTLPWKRTSIPSMEPTQLHAPVFVKDLLAEETPEQIQPPPVPSTWRTPSQHQQTARLAGAGLGLFALRAIPLVGRHADRDVLWSSLRAAKGNHQTRVVVLSGAAGCGKSRLAEWFVRRAHALGAASWMRATHSAQPNPHDGVGAAISHQLVLQGLSRSDAQTRIQQVLMTLGVFDSEETLALTSLAMPATREEIQDGARIVRFRLPIERHVLVQRYIERMTELRPAVLWLDDVQWSPDALHLTEHLLTTGNTPLVVVLTVRDEAIEERPTESRRLADLLAHERVVHLPQVPLSGAEQHALVREMLGLESRLAKTVEARSDGNPLFAVQLVGDWVDRGLLEATARGFAMRPGAIADIPDDLHDMWIHRVERFLRDQPASWGPALGLAAALGNDVDIAEWTTLCNRQNLTDLESLVESLMRANLARADDESWSFVHGMLRESVERASRDSGDWTHHNLACAELLKGTGAPGRLGRHLLAADRFDGACTHLLDDAKVRLFTTELLQAETSLQLAEQALMLSDAKPNDLRWGRLMLRRARLLADQGDQEGSFQLAQKAIALGRQHKWPSVQAWAAMRMGEVLRDRPDVPRASAQYEQALVLFQQIGDAEGQAKVLLELARCAAFGGEYNRAQQLNHQAKEAFDRVPGRHAGHAQARHILADIEVRLGNDLALASRHYRDARMQFHALGMRFGTAMCLNGEAEVARLLGDLEAAEAGYSEAVRLMEAIGHGGRDIMKVNLAICMLEREKWVEARDALRQVSKSMETQERWGLVGCIDTFMLPGIATEGDWEDWRGRLERASWTLREAGMVDRDVARFAEKAGDLAQATGKTEEAQAAWRFAASQWMGCGDDTRADELLGRTD